MNFDIKDINLAQTGLNKILWAEKEMNVLSSIKDRFNKEKPLKGIKISSCLHVTSETANLMITLQSGGADVVLCASNPLSTQDDVAASLVNNFNIPVFAIKGEDRNTYFSHLKSAINHNPIITQDDGADLITLFHNDYKNTIKNVLGGTEETTTGVIRLKNMENNNALKYPIIAVNESETKHLFDNRYGTGQSTIDGLIRATNILLAGKTFVVVGYGYCGKGLAMRAKGMGANVIVTEIDPIKAIEALMDGFMVMPLKDIIPHADIVITVTGNINVINKDDMLIAKDGIIIANSGHFNDEINIKALDEISLFKKEVKPLVVEYSLLTKNRIYLLAEGRLLNLACAEGHPSCVMDMSFANQALAVEYIINNFNKLKNKVYVLPNETDNQIASLKLKSLNIEIDKLTEEQKKYLNSWQFGT